jgi:hypothetical protein
MLKMTSYAAAVVSFPGIRRRRCVNSEPSLFVKVVTLTNSEGRCQRKSKALLGSVQVQFVEVRLVSAHAQPEFKTQQYLNV